MRQIISVLLGVAALSVTSIPGARAADVPVKAPRNAVMADSWNAYFWVDGSGQRVNLPTYNLGPASGLGLTGLYGSQFFNMNPRIDGGGISGGAGYFLPQGMLFGSNGRIEFGGSYVRATGTQSAASGPYNAPGGVSMQLLDGRMVSSFGCVGVCNSSSTLSTTYDSWQINSKIAADLKRGALTVTPSLAVFAGTSRNTQAMNGAENNGFSPLNNTFYTANTQLKWVDWGARLGLDVSANVTNEFSVGVGGSVGLAARRTDLSGSDGFLFTPSGTTVAGTIGVGANKGALLANLEANVGYRLMKNIALTGFVGLNYDNSVPGIVAPSFSGFCCFAAPTTAASIGYQAMTSYYAGGGVAVKF